MTHATYGFQGYPSLKSGKMFENPELAYKKNQDNNKNIVYSQFFLVYKVEFALGEGVMSCV